MNIRHAKFVADRARHNGATQAEAARLVGVNVGTVGRWERRRYSASRRGIYFLQEVYGAIKIGRTNNSTMRIYNLSIQLPYEVELVHFVDSENEHEAESFFHEMFAEERIKKPRGEWFNLMPEQLEYVRRNWKDWPQDKEEN